MHVQEITSLVNLPVYTKEGKFVGNVKNLILDVKDRKVDALLLGRTNPGIVENGRDVSVPYRWVYSFKDILILSHFPERVDVRAPMEEAPPAA
ncbi:MAG: PRC-barrel domain-containing protein [Methanobacteriota archaeon]